jgi:FAD/FMN-containing dehydrogenase
MESEGLFGIITKVRMDLTPKPFMKYVAAYFKEPEFPAYAFMRMYRERIYMPLYGEFLGENSVYTVSFGVAAIFQLV